MLVPLLLIAGASCTPGTLHSPSWPWRVPNVVAEAAARGIKATVRDIPTEAEGER